MKERTITIKTPELSDVARGWKSLRAATSRGLHHLAEKTAPSAKKTTPRKKRAVKK